MITHSRTVYKHGASKKGYIIPRQENRELNIAEAEQWFLLLSRSLDKLVKYALHAAQYDKNYSLEEIFLEIVTFKIQHYNAKYNEDLCRKIFAELFYLGDAPPNRNHMAIMCTLQMNQEPIETLHFWFNLDIIASHLNKYFKIEPPHDFKITGSQKTSHKYSTFSKCPSSNIKSVEEISTIAIVPAKKDSFRRFWFYSTPHTIYPATGSMTEVFKNRFTSFNEWDRRYLVQKNESSSNSPSMSNR